MEKSVYRKHYHSGQITDTLEERAVALAGYMIEHKATVRQTAAAFGVSKSTAHTDVTKRNGFHNRDKNKQRTYPQVRCLFLVYTVGFPSSVF